MASTVQLRGLRRMGRRHFMVLSAALFFGLRLARNTSAEVANEYELKAVFLFHFGSFVDWPAAAFPDDRAPFVIGVVGEDPFGPSLDSVVRSEKVRDRSVQVDRYRRGQALEPCHILFISRSEAPYLPQIFHEIQGQPILSVSDLDRFALLGGIIGFNTGASRVRLTINLKAARGANLAVSSKLLRLAELVEG